MIAEAITAADGQPGSSLSPQKPQTPDRLKQFQACMECRTKRRKCDPGEDPSSPCKSCVKRDLPCTPQEKPSEKSTKARKCAPCVKEKVTCKRENDDLASCKRCEELNIECRPQSKHLKQDPGSQSGSSTGQNGETSGSTTETSYDGMLLGSMTTIRPDTFEFYGGNTGAYYEGSMPTRNGMELAELKTHPNTDADNMTGYGSIALQPLGSKIKGEVDGESAPGLTTVQPWNPSSAWQIAPSDGLPSVNRCGAMNRAAEALGSQWTEFLKTLRPFDGYTYGEKFEPDIVFPLPTFNFEYLPLPML